jgi:hypothetical protein
MEKFSEDSPKKAGNLKRVSAANFMLILGKKWMGFGLAVLVPLQVIAR